MKFLISFSLVLIVVGLSTAMTLVRKDDLELEMESTPVLSFFDDNDSIYENCLKKFESTDLDNQSSRKKRETSLDYFFKFYYLSGLSHVWTMLDNANSENVQELSNNYAIISALNDEKMQNSSLDVIVQLVNNLRDEADSVDNLLKETNKQLHEIIITPKEIESDYSFELGRPLELSSEKENQGENYETDEEDHEDSASVNVDEDEDEDEDENRDEDDEDNQDGEDDEDEGNDQNEEINNEENSNNENNEEEYKDQENDSNVETQDSFEELDQDYSTQSNEETTKKTVKTVKNNKNLLEKHIEDEKFLCKIIIERRKNRFL